MSHKGIQGGCPLSADLDYILKDCNHKKASVFGSATRPLLLPFSYEDRDKGEEKIVPVNMRLRKSDATKEDFKPLEKVPSGNRYSM